MTDVFLAGCDRRGIRVPEDLSVIGIDDTLNDVVERVNATGLRLSASILFDGTDYRMQIRGLDTGVSNDSYAIIELGMVDDIIKDKDNSRRRMLEQAAGISIYKTRKKEAKQKRTFDSKSFLSLAF
mgnify:CR=1 FL=1